MHQPSLQPYPSSYLEYEIFPFARPPEMDGTAQMRHPVVTVYLIAVRDDGVRPADADGVVHDTQGCATERWGAMRGAIYVLRPDQHVCARWMVSSPTRVAQVLDRAIGASKSTLD